MFDFQNICKFCGSTDFALLYNVFDTIEEANAFAVTLPFRIKDSLQIQVVQGDKICHKCVYSVNSHYLFKEHTTRTYKRLHKTLQEIYAALDDNTDADEGNEDVQILEEKLQEQPVVELPKQQLPAKPVVELPKQQLPAKPVTATKAPETVVIDLDLPGSSGTSKNSTSQRAPVNNNEPVRKGKRPRPSPSGPASNSQKCHEEQHSSSLDFRDELQEVDNHLVMPEEADSTKGKCNVCSKIFTNTQSLQRHLVTHSLIRPFMCRICKKTFKDHSYLVKHERIHSMQPRQFTCLYCDLPFTLRRNLHRHMKNTHFIDSKSDSDVEVTAQVVPHNSDDRECSSSPEHPVVCRLCLRTFRDVEGLNKHKIVHDKEMFQCDECPETFSEQSNLDKHRNYIHSLCETCLCPKLYECCCVSKRRRRTFSQLNCPKCSTSFPDTFVLIMHLRGCSKGKKNDKEIVLID